MSSTCITAQDVLDYPFCCDVSDQLCCPFEAIDMELCSVISLVEAITGTVICPYVDCKVFDGDGSKNLYFNPFTSHKLITFTSVDATACCDITCPSTDDPTNCSSWLEYQCSGSFPCGSKNITVCGTWGSFETVPDGLKKAIIQLTLENLQPGITGIETSQGLVDSVSWSDFSINYNTADLDVTVPTTGFPSIDRLLQSYIPTISQIKFGVIDSCNSTLCKHNTFRNECSQCQ